METRINRTPRLTEELDEHDYDGDFLGGVMANVDYVNSRDQAATPEVPSQDIVTQDEIGMRTIYSRPSVCPGDLRGMPEPIGPKFDDNSRGKLIQS